MKYLFAVLNLFCIIAAPAQEIIGESGLRKKAGGYEIELSGCLEQLTVHVYKNHKLLEDVKINGFMEYFYPDGSYLTQNSDMMDAGGNLRIRIPYPGFYTLKITLFISPHTIHACFDNACNLKKQNTKVSSK